MTASARSRRAFSTGRKSRMPRGGLTGEATPRFFHPLGGRLAAPDLGLQAAERRPQRALGVEAAGPCGEDDREQQRAELVLVREREDGRVAGRHDPDLFGAPEELV